ncbi:MAG: TldD/PmbA family protein [Candidatus Bathyarchaeota archaeon]|nr:TldD/PmbA family protein [Candidatus Bathyarchaeota archaeon A05DMB-5]MDH7558495.1 TldD/PmbA family protein [Candidatus Bathyarchaeota archaeon]
MESLMEEDLALFAVGYAVKLGADYVDVRLEDHYNELITVADGKVQRGVINRKRGLGVRTLVNGAWGFQSTTNLSKKGVGQAAEIAFKTAKASSRHVHVPVKLAPAKAYKTSYKTKVKVDLENVAFEDKLKEMLVWEKKLHTSKRIVRGSVEFTGIKIDKVFVNSEGADIRFSNSVAWVGLKADAKKGDVTQFYEKMVGHSGGYEIFQKNDMEEISVETGRKAESLLEAKAVKTEKDAVVVLDSNYVALLTHEIVGHPSEADRVLGREAAWAGTTWWAGKIGEKIGSDYFTAYDDPTVAGTLGYFLYDDEGVKAKRKVLIEKGVLKGHMHSRETAAVFGVEPNAGMRAITFEYIPLIRMSNTFLGEGDWKKGELIEDTKHGYLISCMRHPSIDDKRYNWTISAQEAYEIKNGELTTHLRDIALTSTAPKVFKSINAATKDAELVPLPGCGKGDPMQSLYVGNGGPYIRGVATVLGVQ